ncbi:MAG: hypothetical protein R2695_02040 [Acidimicrobiales bacterium]
MSGWALAALVVGSFGCKWLGVTVLARVGRDAGTGGSGGSGMFPAMAALIPAALFAALVAVQALEVDGALRVDARFAGVAAGAVAVWRRAPFVVVIGLAMAVTAVIRWQTSG